MFSSMRRTVFPSWGHDWPDYRQIVQILQILPTRMIPILAATATANDRVVAEVLRINWNGDLPSLQTARFAHDIASARHKLVITTRLKRMSVRAGKRPAAAAGIRHCLLPDQYDCERLAEWLARNGIDARAYHGGTEDRAHLENQLIDDNDAGHGRAGYGVDKPDLGFIISFQRPQSVIASPAGGQGRARGRWRTRSS